MSGRSEVTSGDVWKPPAFLRVGLSIFLRRAAGQPDSSEGRDQTRELLRHVKRGRKRARILARADPAAPEMWGLRDD